MKVNPFDKHQFAPQPVYSLKIRKQKAREQVVAAYRHLTGNYSIPPEKEYWTFCNEQPDVEGSEINQLVIMGLIKKSQFYGVDYDIQGKGIIQKNKDIHPDAHWFKGDWIDVIYNDINSFNPGLIYFDYTRTVVSIHTYLYLAKTMNICPPDTIVAANLMLSDGHSKKRFDPNLLVKKIWGFLRYPDTWELLDMYYQYKASQTEMATYIFRGGYELN